MVTVARECRGAMMLLQCILLLIQCQVVFYQNYGFRNSTFLRIVINAIEESRHTENLEFVHFKNCTIFEGVAWGRGCRGRGVNGTRKHAGPPGCLAGLARCCYPTRCV